MPKEGYRPSAEQKGPSAKDDKFAEMMTVGPDGILYSKEDITEKKEGLPKWDQRQANLMLKYALANSSAATETLSAYLAGSKDKKVVAQLREALKTRQRIEDLMIGTRLSSAIAEGKSRAEQDAITKNSLDKIKHLKKLEDWLLWRGE